MSDYGICDDAGQLCSFPVSGRCGELDGVSYDVDDDRGLEQEYEREGEECGEAAAGGAVWGDWADCAGPAAGEFKG